MYETHIDTRYIYDDEEYEVEHSSVLTDEEKDYFSNAVCMKFDRDKYKETVGKLAMSEIEDFFKDYEEHIKIKLVRGTERVDSPREYNFHTDCLIFDVEIEQEELDRIASVVESDEQFWEWARENYQSRDGFISFMPYWKDDYLKEIVGGPDVDRALSMYLTYIYRRNYGFDNYEPEFGYNYNILDQLRSNHGLSDFLNDDRANDILAKAHEGG